MIAKPVRLLVLRGGAIGDFVATLPALRALRNRWPEAYIELIGYPHVARLALQDGLVDRVESLDRAGIALYFAEHPVFPPAQTEFIRSFDLVLSYLHDRQGLVRDNLERAGAKQVIYGSPLVEGDHHAVDHLLKPLETLAIYETGAQPALRLDPELRAAGQALLAERGLCAPVYVLHPGSGSPRKNWPLERFVALADRIRRAGLGRPVFLVGEADEPLRRSLQERWPDTPLFADLSVLQACGLLSACQAYIGNDSGVTHLAAALGLPVLALFGPSSVRHWAPRGTRVQVVAARSGELAALSPDEIWPRVAGLTTVPDG